MENCTIYSHHLAFDKIIQLVKESLPKAKVEFNDGGAQKSLRATIKGGLFGKTKTLTINYRERLNPSYKLEKIECPLTQNLAGMVNHVQSIPAQNEALRNKFLIKVMSANCEIPFMADPEITPEFRDILEQVVGALDGFIFTSPSRTFGRSDTQHFLDKNLALILDANGICEVEDVDVSVDAKYHDEPAENATTKQVARKKASESFLHSRGIKVNGNLPFIPDEANIILRTKNMVIDRAYALMIIAVLGEGASREHLSRPIKEKNIDGFSPREMEILNTKALNDQEKAYAIWRYESLYVLLWALHLEEHLVYPDEICDVKTLVSKIFHPSREEFENNCQLRSKEEILDELDKTYRMNWSCVDARVKGESLSGNINPSIVYERHYALNWLTNYQNQDWDHISTDT